MGLQVSASWADRSNGDALGWEKFASDVNIEDHWSEYLQVFENKWEHFQGPFRRLGIDIKPAFSAN